MKKTHTLDYSETRKIAGPDSGKSIGGERLGQLMGRPSVRPARVAGGRAKSGVKFR